ncbi:MAG: Tfp pilus assembly protein FimT/FimU, partial [Rubrivivax sp.]
MSHRPRQRQFGTTLVEAMIVLALIGLLVGSVWPGWADARDRRSLEAASAQLATDLRLTRSLAVAQGGPVRFSVPAAQACYVVHTGPARACSCDATGAATCTGEAQALRVASLPGAGRIALSSSSASMLFDAERG